MKVLFLILLLAIPVAAIIDLQRGPADKRRRIFWFVTIAFTFVLGALLYFFVGKRQKNS